jgi:tetratricopeptide (TPR) repeat protein
MTAEQLIDAAGKAHVAGNLHEALDLAGKALQSAPDDPKALLLMGIVGAQKNDLSSAVPAPERLLELEPDSFDAPFWLSMVYRRNGRMIEALAMAQRAVKANGEDAHAINQLGQCYMALNQREEAAASFSRACSLAPNIGPFFEMLGRALQSMGKTQDAIAAFRRALAVGPVRPAGLFLLGDAYMSEPNVQAAAEIARTILKMEPNSVSGNLLLARALIGDGDVAQGAKFAQRAIELSPGNAVPVAYYGRALQSLGRIQEADEQFRRSIALEPRQGFGYHSLVHNHKVREDERPLVEKMRQLVGEGDLPQRELIQLHYGLGKALEDLGEYEEAMQNFDAANRIDHQMKSAIAPFDKSRVEANANFLINTFTKEFIDHHKAGASASDLPIFVVGMMRSGTTLAEQIISSHPEVGGAGEQLFWPLHCGAGDLLFARGPQGLTLDIPRLRALAKEYVAQLENVAPGKPRVVDKMNTNSQLLGLIHIAFPNAKIIHMNRHPVDTSLSIWATPVAAGIDLCGEKENVVANYKSYLRVMAHYRSVLPADRFLDVQYEDLVADQENVTRQMIEFCDLEWNEACLRPESNERSVKTPSVWQVRQPVYKTSTARWRKYEPWLGAFAELFEYADHPR